MMKCHPESDHPATGRPETSIADLLRYSRFFDPHSQVQVNQRLQNVVPAAAAFGLSGQGLLRSRRPLEEREAGSGTRPSGYCRAYRLRCLKVF